MSLISPITQILNNLREVKASHGSMYIGKGCAIVADASLKANSYQLYLHVIKVISNLALSNNDLQKLPRIYSIISSLYPNESTCAISTSFLGVCRIDKHNLGIKISSLRKSLSLLVVMKEELKLLYHFLKINTQSALLQAEREKYTRIKGEESLFQCDSSTFVGFIFHCHKFFDRKKTIEGPHHLVLRTDLSYEEKAKAVSLLPNLDDKIARALKIQLIVIKAIDAAKLTNEFCEQLGDYYALYRLFKLDKKGGLFGKIFPLFSDLKQCFWNFFKPRTAAEDVWTPQDMELLGAIFSKIDPKIAELDRLYEYQYHELQVVLNMYVELPEMREALFKRIYPSITDKRQVFVESDEDESANDITGDFIRSSFPHPIKYAENFFAYYENFNHERIVDYRDFTLPIPSKMVEHFSEKIERKEDDEEKIRAQLISVKPAPKRRASYSDQEWHKLFEAHSNQFPAGIKYDQRVENWFSKLEEKPIATLGDKAAALKHRLPKILDVLVGTAYSRSGIFEEVGRRHDSWYLAMRITAFDRVLDGVLAYTFDVNGMVYHRYFEKEAQGNELVNEILPWLIENTQSPTPQEVSKMDKKKQETNEKKPSGIAPIPKGIEIEPYFGTLTLHYEDQEIFYNGAPVQVKIEVFKPG